jgi:putative spermidine/putrescine transport system permease protein
MSIALENTTDPVQISGTLRRNMRNRRMYSLLLIAPLLCYVILTFIIPIGMMFYKAVENAEIVTAFPQTTVQLARWDSASASELPPDAVYQSFLRDIAGGSRGDIGEAARRLNYEITGYRSLLTTTLRKARPLPADIDSGNTARDFLSAIDSRWADPAFWHAMQRASGAYTPYYMLAALDLKLSDSSEIVQVAQEQRAYVDILLRTLRIATVVTLICLILGYPLANLMLTAPKPFAVVLMIAVLLPFWTSLLARTSAWIVLLQREGLINGLFGYLGLISQPLELIFNTTGLYIVMVHMMLPFMVLPIYSTMKGIPPHFMKASASLGANPWRSFREVYLPMTLPGVGAGALLTFIVTTGYYITPSLVGSARDQMLGYFIAFFANTTINWGMASALGIILLLCTLGIYLVATRTVGVRQLAGLK